MSTSPTKEPRLQTMVSGLESAANRAEDTAARTREKVACIVGEAPRNPECQGNTPLAGDLEARVIEATRRIHAAIDEINAELGRVEY